MTFLEAQQALCRKLDISYSEIAYNGLFTLTDIKEYLNTAGRKLWDLKNWDFTEMAKTGTLSSTEVTNGYVAFPQDVNFSSIKTLVINGEVWDTKLTHNDYLKWQEAEPTSTDKVWSEWNNILFFNPNAVSVGQTIDAYGKMVYPERSADADLMMFSASTDAYGNSGNDALVQMAYAEALGSEKKKNPAQAKAERDDAMITIELLNKTLSSGRTKEQSPYSPMFDPPDFFGNNGRSAGTFSV